MDIASSSKMAATFAYTHSQIPNFPKKLHLAAIESTSMNPIPTPSTKIQPSNLKQTKRKNKSKSFRKDNHFLLTRHLQLFLESGSLENALQMFDKMLKRDTFMWNVMIRGLVSEGFYEMGIDFYYKMKIDGVKPDYFTYPFVVKACSGVDSIDEGKKVHANVVKSGLKFDVYVCNSLISMYGKVGCIDCAERVFEEMEFRDLVSWNSMINGFVSVGDGWKALMIFRDMSMREVGFDGVSLMGALGACSIECCLQMGKEIHGKILRDGFEMDFMIQTSIIDMYSKCGLVDYAERYFGSLPQKRSVGVWNAMIGAYSFNGRAYESFTCLKKMQEADNTDFDVITVINLLPACAKLGGLLQGRSVHGFVTRRGFLPHIVLETSLIDMYGRCQRLDMAKCVFESMIKKSLISWNAMIAAYVQNEGYKEGLKLFQRFLNATLEPDAITIASILPAYSEFALLREGKQIHGYVTSLGLGLNTHISNGIVYMYAKCGDLSSSQKFFDEILHKDVVSWNTIILAYALHGLGNESIRLFSDMNEKGIKPNGSTFLSLLSACSISGMFDEGWKYFSLMKSEYEIDPGIEHYGCMLDLLGRRGNLNMALRFIEEMPFSPTVRIWGSLLSASRNNKNIELAERVSDHILSMQHDNTGCYILLSNMYAELGMWDKVKKIKPKMNEQGLQRTPGCSKVEIRGKNCRFYNRDRSHNETNTIYDVLDVITRKIKEAIYVYSLNKFNPEKISKKRANSAEFHSVRLAISYGLIRNEIGRPILVRKNIRICEKCHDFGKKISAINGREIIVGDSKIFHHFKNGSCSCADYW